MGLLAVSFLARYATAIGRRPALVLRRDRDLAARPKMVMLDAPLQGGWQALGVGMGRKFAAALVMLIALLLAASPAFAGVKLALVIGNGKYRSVPALENPPNDAADLGDALRKVGFEVIVERDATREAMTKAIREFASRLKGADVALFFYAGHGMQMNGENYLLPIDAEIETPADLRFNTVDLTDIQQEMEGDGRVNIIILDACRNNPFAERLAAKSRSAPTPGLGRVDAAGEGSLIVYSTQPNNVAYDGGGGNSPFTAALIKHIATPGLEVRQMLSRVRGDVLQATGRRQTPWDSSSLTGDVFLAGPPPATPLAAASPTPSQVAAETPSVSRAPVENPSATAAPTAGPKPPAPPKNECERLIAFAPPFASPDQLKRARHVDWPAAAAACAAAAAAEPDDERMQFYYGLALGHTNEVVESVRRLKMATEAGDADAMVDLGFDFATGKGVAKNGERAFELFSKAAAAGSATGLDDLGAMYANGLFVKPDFAKALDYYEKAIEAGEPFALTQIAVLYFNGSGVERDYNAAAEYLQQAADLDDGYALKFLAIMYERGLIGGKVDLEKAGALRARAAEVDPNSQTPNVPPPPPAQVLRPRPRTHYVVIRRYRFFGCNWMWC
jgi:tetratricopeptide (TPR) repeat protein